MLSRLCSIVLEPANIFASFGAVSRSTAFMLFAFGWIRLIIFCHEVKSTVTTQCKVEPCALAGWCSFNMWRTNIARKFVDFFGAFSLVLTSVAYVICISLANFICYASTMSQSIKVHEYFRNEFARKLQAQGQRKKWQLHLFVIKMKAKRRKHKGNDEDRYDSTHCDCTMCNVHTLSLNIWIYHMTRESINDDYNDDDVRLWILLYFCIIALTFA